MTQIEQKFTLRGMGKVTIKPVLKARGMIKDSQHEAYFLIGNSYIEYSAPVDGHGNLICPLNEEEISFFEDRSVSKMHFNVGDLSVYAPLEQNFWRKKESKVKLNKKGVTFDLTIPGDYLKYKTLLANKKEIAPSWKERFDRPSYLFAVVREGDELQTTLTKTDKNKRAYIEYGKMEGSALKMITFLKAAGKKPAASAEKDWLKAQISEMIDTNVDGFLRILDNPNYDYLVLLNDCVDKGFIKRNGKSYVLTDSDKVLCEDGEAATKESAVKYLKNDEDLRMTLEARLEE